MDQSTNQVPQGETPAKKVINKTIVPVAAVHLPFGPNRQQRNFEYTELGTFDFSENPSDKLVVKAFANKVNGSMLFVMPDQSTYEISTAVAGNQIFQYWTKNPPSSIITES